MMNESGKAVAPPGPAPTDAEALRQLNAQLEQRVAERTAELQAILDLAPVAVWIAHDTQCLWITGNRYADELVMQAPRGGNISASARPGDAAVSYKVFRDGVELKPEELPAQVAAATGRAVEPELLDLLFSDGRVAYMFMGATPLLDAGGRARGAVAAGADVTPLRRAEEALRVAHERLTLAQESAHAGAWDWDMSAGKLEWSPELFHLFGQDPSKTEATFDLWRKIMHPDDRQAAEENVNVAVRDRTKLRNEYRVVLPSGDVRWISAVGETNYDDKGRPVRMSGLCMDVTRRRMAEDALRASEERYRTLVELAPDAVIVEQDERFVFANPAAVRLYGADSPNQLIGRSVLELVHPDDRERVRHAGDGALAGETSPLRDVRILRLDGQATWTDGSSIPVNFDGCPAIQVMIHDVTGRKKAEEEIRRRIDELRAANEELARFNRAAVDRELRMIELKKQVNELCVKLGESQRYGLEFEKENQ